MATDRDKASTTTEQEQEQEQISGGLHFNKIEWVLKEDRVGATRKPASDYSVWIGCS